MFASPFFDPSVNLFVFDCVIVFLVTMAWLEIFQILPNDSDTSGKSGK